MNEFDVLQLAIDIATKHGKHNQKAHGRRGGSGGNAADQLVANVRKGQQKSDKVVKAGASGAVSAEVSGAKKELAAQRGDRNTSLRKLQPGEKEVIDRLPTSKPTKRVTEDGTTEYSNGPSTLRVVQRDGAYSVTDIAGRSIQTRSGVTKKEAERMAEYITSRQIPIPQSTDRDGMNLLRVAVLSSES